MLTWTRYMDGSYRANNGAADFKLGKVAREWSLTASHREGGVLFSKHRYLADAKREAVKIACRAGWHKV